MSESSLNNNNKKPTSYSSSSPPPPPKPSFPAREDCWTEEATHTLVHSWGSHYLHLNRGNLRQQHWQQVADQVNSLHALSKKQHRTDIQCKNRIDTLKKRFKIEKSQTLLGTVSAWPFFDALDALIGESFVKNNFPVSPPPESSPATAVTDRRDSPAMVVSDRRNSPAMVVTERRSSPAMVVTDRRSSLGMVGAGPVWKLTSGGLPLAVPVGPRSKRPVSVEALSRRNFSAMAAAAARAVDEEDDDDGEDEGSDMSGGAGFGMRGRGCREDSGVADGYRRLAEAIGRFAEVYQRVESSKQRQAVELEKQRLQFTKDLEIQRMKLFMESQVHLERIKRVKRNSENGE